jgi:hypothetical protein
MTDQELRAKRQALQQHGAALLRSVEGHIRGQYERLTDLLIANRWAEVGADVPIGKTTKLEVRLTYRIREFE